MSKISASGWLFCSLSQLSPHPLATPAPNPLRSVCPAPVLLPRIPFAQPSPYPFHDLFPCLPCSTSSTSIRMRCLCKFPLDKSGKLWYFIISNDNHYCFALYYIITYMEINSNVNYQFFSSILFLRISKSSFSVLIFSLPKSAQAVLISKGSLLSLKSICFGAAFFGSNSIRSQKFL